MDELEIFQEDLLDLKIALKKVISRYRRIYKLTLVNTELEKVHDEVEMLLGFVSCMQEHGIPLLPQ